jgi:hypothetical protein
VLEVLTGKKASIYPIFTCTEVDSKYWHAIDHLESPLKIWWTSVMLQNYV